MGSVNTPDTRIYVYASIFINTNNQTYAYTSNTEQNVGSVNEPDTRLEFEPIIHK